MLRLQLRFLYLQGYVLLPEDRDVGADALNHQVVARWQVADCRVLGEPAIEGGGELRQPRLYVLDEV